MSKHLEMAPLSPAERRRALLDFDDLLKSDASEHVWQQFFEDHPTILADSLALQLDGIYAQVRLVAGTPDYVFHRSLGGKTGDYGVIELKRPSDSILGTYSVKHLVPSRKVATARVQAERYLASIQRGEFLNTDDFFIAGNRRHAFIIIGNSEELTKKCRSELHQLQLQELLPAGINLYTYDEVLQLFAATVPPPVKVVFASDVAAKPKMVVADVMVVDRLGLDGGPCATIVRISERYAAEATLGRMDGTKVSTRAFIDLMYFAAAPGTPFRLECVGADAEACVQALIQAEYTHGGHEKTRLFEVIRLESKEV